MDMDRFTRALRLRWMLFQWKQKNKACTNLEVPCDRVDRELFYASTIVTIGDGKMAPFWTSCWINGNMAKSIAPLLYAKSRRKKITVHQALKSEKWIDHIYPPATSEEMTQFVRLWEAIREVARNETVEDTITWRWTMDGEYTTKSAYQIQFTGVLSKLKLTPIWKAKAEQKCRFFCVDLVA